MNRPCPIRTNPAMIIMNIPNILMTVDRACRNNAARTLWQLMIINTTGISRKLNQNKVMEICWLWYYRVNISYYM